MSNWMHVAAIFRIDGFRFNGIPQPDFDEVFGKECLWDGDCWDEHDAHPERFLPCGSEGSLEKSVWVNPDESSLAAYTVSVFGDLRDYESFAEIEEWFDRCCSKVLVRQAICEMQNEWFGTKTIKYKG